jgi:hypothetical protein
MVRTSVPLGVLPAQDGRHRLARPRLIDVDRQKAALVVMRVEQRQLSMPVHPVERVVDIQHDRRRRPRPTRAKQIDHGRHHACDFDLRWRVLQPRHRRLRAQRRPALRKPPHRQLEHRIAPQRVAVVRVLVARRDGEHPQPQHLDDLMIDPRAIAPVHQASGHKLGEPNAPLDIAQQQHPAIRRQKAAVERHTHLLAADRWQRKRKKAIVVHGGCGAPRSRR